MGKTLRLILYRNLEEQMLLDSMAALLEGEKSSEKWDSYQCANQLVELADRYGFEGNLWHCFLAYCLANHENAYSTACEISEPAGGTIRELAAHDFGLIKELFDLDITELPGDFWKSLTVYQAAQRTGKAFNRRIRDRIVMLAKELERAADTEAFQGYVTDFYREFGVGRFGLNKAFRIEESGPEEAWLPRIEPITRIDHVYLKDLVGYDLQKQKLIANTEAFIAGKEANNVLLYGDAGTGKSSSIKAVLNEYYDKGLRMIEVYKHQFRCLSNVLEEIKNRNYKFIIYMDDLSFEDFEIEYKYLKAIIEGGLGKKPSNVLIYATSNRRHLIREKFSDKREILDDLHGNDTVQEKLSLVARFGVTIYYGAPDKYEFQEIVKALAERSGISMPQEELLAEANKWELYHGGLSGRTAAQFITYLLGKKEE